MGDALIDVWFSLLGLSCSLAHTYKVLKKHCGHAHALCTLRGIGKPYVKSQDSRSDLPPDPPLWVKLGS